jgi:hypothetical protein
LSRFSTMMLSKEAGRELALFCRRCIWIFPHHCLFPVRWAVDILHYHVKVSIVCPDKVSGVMEINASS